MPITHPYVIAHRGFSGKYPENTRIAFQRAIEVGADWIELDVVTSADDVLVVHHDSTVDRCTNGSGAVHEMTLEQLKKLDAGSWFAPKFAGEPIITLDEVLELVTPTPLRLAIEIKGHDREQFLRTAHHVVAMLQARDWLRRAVVTSFDPACLLEIKRLEPTLATSLDPEKQDGTYTPWELCGQVMACASNFLQHHHQALTEDIVQEARAHGFVVWAWTVNDADDMRRMIAVGADAIVSDYPDVARAIIADW